MKKAELAPSNKKEHQKANHRSSSGDSSAPRRAPREGGYRSSSGDSSAPRRAPREGGYRSSSGDSSTPRRAPREGGYRSSSGDFSTPRRAPREGGYRSSSGDFSTPRRAPREGGYRSSSGDFSAPRRAPREGGYRSSSGDFSAPRRAPREGGYRSSSGDFSTPRRAPREGGYRSSSGDFSTPRRAPREGGYRSSSGDFSTPRRAPREGGYRSSSGDFSTPRRAPREGGYRSSSGDFSTPRRAPREGGYRSSSGGFNAPKRSGFRRDSYKSGSSDFKPYKKAESSFVKKEMSDKEFIYGLNPVRLALQANRRTFHEIYIAKEEDSLDRDKNLLEIQDLAEKRSLKINFVDKSNIDKNVPGMNHQGVCLLSGLLPTFNLNNLLESRNIKTLIAIDHIQDTHNLGAILRSACYFGFDGLITTDMHSAPLNSTTSKTSAGLIEIFKIFKVTNLANSLKELKKQDFWILGTDITGTSIYDFQTPEKFVLVLGNEHKGLRKLIIDESDWVLTIPGKLNLESLNVSVAAGILMSLLKK